MTAKRHHYAIGDLQGCFAALQALKKTIAFDEQQDVLWFAGDLVARGEDSLSTLREVKRLCEIGAAHTVLGNHDLNLLAVWRGFNKLRGKDQTEAILLADDAAALLNWLRCQPLLLQPNRDSVLTHAGLPHIWSVSEARAYAAEVQAVLSADHATLDTFLAAMFGNQPEVWSADLQGWPRLRVITNYFTRMRLLTRNGTLEFGFKDGLAAPMPAGFAPWFVWPPQQPRAEQLLFGHWAALEGAIGLAHVEPLDGGCVWGGRLIAYRLGDGQRFSVSAGCG